MDKYLPVSVVDTDPGDIETANWEAGGADFPRAGNTSIGLVLRAAAKHEDDVISYLRHIYTLCNKSRTSCVARTVVTLTAVAIFIIGLIRFRECPYEQEIPLFLVLEGGALIVINCIYVLGRFQTGATVDGERQTLHTFSDILMLFLILWGLTGSVWIFEAYRRVNMDSTDSPEYCDRLVYLSALWFLVSSYCALFIVIILCIVLSSYFCIANEMQKTHHPMQYTC